LPRHPGSFPLPRPAFVVPTDARDRANARGLVKLGDAPPRRPCGSRSTHRSTGSPKGTRATSDPVTTQETAYQKIKHVRRSVGQVAELEGERFVATRRVMQAAGRHAKDAQLRRFATVNSLSRDTMRPSVDDPWRSAARRSDHLRRRRKTAPDSVTWVAARTISGR
jgi:hypothetical protein